MIGICPGSAPSSSRSTRPPAAQPAGTAGVSVLFGFVFGISSVGAVVAALLAGTVGLLVVLIARLLMFATPDEAAAAARGVPVRLLGYCFLSPGRDQRRRGHPSGRLPAPARPARRPCGHRRPAHRPPLPGTRPLRRPAVPEMWAGLFASCALPKMPPSFAIMAATRRRPHTTAASGPRMRPSGGGCGGGDGEQLGERRAGPRGSAVAERPRHRR